MRRALRLAVTSFTLLSFSAQILGAESLALFAGPTAARQMMPRSIPPESVVARPIQAPARKAKPKVEPVPEWGFYVLAAGEIVAEEASMQKQAVDHDLHLLAASGEEFYKETTVVLAGLRDGVQSAQHELSVAAFGDPADLTAKYAPINLPYARGPMTMRGIRPQEETQRSVADSTALVQRAPESIRPASPNAAREAVPGEEKGLEISEAQFRSKVLESATPALVMFDATRNCHCAEEALLQLKAQWRGHPAVYSLNADDSPTLAAQYGVTDHAVALLFKKGKLIDSADASAMEKSVTARRGRYVSDDMKNELARFAGPLMTVVLYSTAWCPHCREAERYLSDHGIAFEDHDIDRDPIARAQYESYHRPGVPLAVINGAPVTGFQPDEFDKLIKL